MYQCNLQGHRRFTKFCSFSSMLFVVSVVPFASYCMPHVCHKLNKLCKLFELCVCLIFSFCCNHFTLMLYYRQHLCVALKHVNCI